MLKCVTMCQSVNYSKTPKWNARVSHLLIVAGLTLLAVKSGQSMPSRDFRHSPPSSFSDVHRDSEEFGEIEDPPAYRGPPKYPRNRSESRDTAENEGRHEITAPRTASSDRDAIKYPGDWERNLPNFLPEPIPDCQGKTFCEETASSYPQEYLSNLISRTESLKLFSGVDQIDLAQRVDSADGGELLCGSETRIVYPKTAQNGAKEWLFVLQDEKQGYKQGVKVENCDVGTAEGTCKIIEGSIYGYKTFCKQKYVARVMAAVHKNGTAVTENFSMPSSCCCQLKLIGDGVAARFGGVTPKNQTPAPRKTRRNR